MKLFSLLLTEIKKIQASHLPNGMWLSFRNIFIALFSLAVTYVSANHLDPTVLGSYKYLIGLVSFISVFTLTGDRSALVRTIAKTGKNPTLFITKKSFLTSWGAATILLIIAVYYLMQENHIFAISIATAAILLPFSKASALFSAFLNATQRYRQYGTTKIIVQAFIGASVIIAILISGNLLLITCVYFCSSALIQIILYLWTAHKYSFSHSSEEGIHTYNFAKRLSRIYWLKKIIDQTDTILAFQLVNPVATATFAIAKTPIQLLISQGAVVRTLALPRFSKHPASSVRSSIHRKAIVFFLVMTLISSLYILLAGWLYSVFFPVYLSSSYYSQILATILPALPHILYLEAITATLDTRKLFIIENTTSIIRVLLMFILTLFYGLIGLTIGFVIAYWIRAISTILIYYYKDK